MLRMSSVRHMLLVNMCGSQCPEYLWISACGITAFRSGLSPHALQRALWFPRGTIRLPEVKGI